MEDPGTKNSLDPELAKRALEEVNEKPEERDRCIQELRELILAEKKFRAPTDDAFLVRFLRSCSYNVDWAFKTIHKYFQMKSRNPHMYKNYRPSTKLNVFNEKLHTVLPDRDPLGRRIILLRSGHWNPQMCSVEDVFICVQFCLESVIVEDETQISGVCIIIDTRGFGLSQAGSLRPHILKKYIALFQEYFPARFKGLHFIYEPSLLKTSFNIFKPLLKKEVIAMVHFHGENEESLHEFFPPEILPQEIGGLKPTTDNSAFVKFLLERDDEIADVLENYGYF